MVEKTMSAITLDDGKTALSENHPKVEIWWPRPANELIDVLVGEVTDASVREAACSLLALSQHSPTDSR
jgi:hypothetical protein